MATDRGLRWPSRELCAEKARQSLALEKMKRWPAISREPDPRTGIRPVEPPCYWM